MIRYANIEDAKKAVVSWDGNPFSVVHLGDSGNSVFCFKNSQGQPQILRFTDPDFRSTNEVLAELNWVNFLHKSGVLVAQGLPTVNGIYAFPVECTSGTLICSSVAYAEGIEVQENSHHWTPTFFKEWGRNLALIHNLSAAYKPTATEPKRWHWDVEVLISRAEELIPSEDETSREEFLEVVSRCKALAKSDSTYGLIHADHAPQNFRYDPDLRIITAFDFGNCCYHWFVSDLAISLSTIRRKANRELIREGLLEGYSAIRELPPDYNELIDLFIRLRVLYVYLSRLYLWSENRTVSQEKDLNTFKNLVHLKAGWHLSR